MEKRVVFRSQWLPYLLLAPQLAITIIFFFWPASQALVQSVQQQDPFGITVEFVGLENFRALFADEHYLASFRVTVIFSSLVAGFGLLLSLILAVFADRAMRGAGVYTTLLIWPYAVAHAVAAVLWLFLFNPTLGIVAHWIKGLGIGWDPLLNGRDAMILVVNIIHAFFNTFAIIDTATQGGPGNATEILVYKVYKDGFKALDLGSSAAQSVILMTIVIVLTVIQFRFIERKVQY